MGAEHTPTAETRPFLPVDVMVEEVCDDGSDLNDGDHCGYFQGRWNPDSQELLLSYQPADDDEYQAEHRATDHVFRLGAQARVGGPTLGETAYSGYFTACGGRSLISGAELPSWDEQSDSVRAAWDAAADAVRRAC